MKLTLAGLGMGTPGTITAEAKQALMQAQAVIGAARLLEDLPEGATSNRAALTAAPEILTWLEQHPELEHVCVVFSGDTGCYSGAAALYPKLIEAGHEAELLPGISAMQYFAARLGEPWQDWRYVSAHGRACDILAEVLNHPACFFLTGGETTPEEICTTLCRAGLRGARVTVGARLSYPDEQIITGTAAQLVDAAFPPLACVLVERDVPAFNWPSRSCGIPDGEFVRGEVPMTKSEVRSVVLSRLALRENDIVWDIGAGTGSVSVEAALIARRGRVFAVEQNKSACELLYHNRHKFGVYNLQVREGAAPEALGGLPAPDAVFIGGSGGKLEEIIATVLAAAPATRIALSAVTLETAFLGLQALQQHGCGAVQAVQLAVTRLEAAGSSSMFKAQNPIFIISGVGPGG